MAVDKERMKKLLGAGVSGELVAATLGCDASYVSQCLADEVFRDEVISLRVAALTATTERDAKIDGIEDSLLEKIIESVDYITKPRELISAFNVINAAKRRGVGVGQNTVQNNVVVNLILPTVVQQKFTTNSVGEVVEVDGKTTITMSPAQLLKQLAEEKGVHDAIKAQELRALANRLPSEVFARTSNG